MSDSNDQYFIWLSCVPTLLPKHFDRLLTVFGDARSVWSANADDILCVLPGALGRAVLEARNNAFFDGIFEQMVACGARAVLKKDDGYPPMLLEIFDPPPTLFVRGRVDLCAPRMFGVVGTRHPTYDGRRAAKELSAELAKRDVCVVSGFALGVDALAHEGCVSAGGRTIAVLAGGVDAPSPLENERLIHPILDAGGGFVSEVPPGVRAMPRDFPARNRIISGLCPGVLIIEGRIRSGAMITARHALEQDRDVFALPGSIYNEAAEGPNSLIQDGAKPVLSVFDILEEYRWAERPGKEPDLPKLNLTDEENAIVKPLRRETLGAEELSNLTGISQSRLNSHLTMLELRGIIKKVPGGYRAAQ